MADIKALLTTSKYKTEMVRVGTGSDGFPEMLISYDPHKVTTNDVSLEIVMPFPTNISSGQSVLWDQQDAGLVGNLKGSGTSIASIKQSLTEFYRDFEASIGLEVSKNALGLGASALGMNGDAIKGQLSKQAGKIINPNKEMYFSGVDFRTFSFEFRLVPKSRSEAAAITMMIRQFHHGSLPDYDSSGGNRLLLYPGRWKIDWLEFSDHLPNIKSCYLTNIAVDYSAVGNSAIHKDGAPMQTNLTLSFTEAEIATKQDYGKGNTGVSKPSGLETGYTKSASVVSGWLS